MGLDQYSYAKASGGADDGKQEPLVSWRKHNRLHGWMKNLFEEKGLPGINGMDGPNTFNTVELPLTFADVADLRATSLSGGSPKPRASSSVQTRMMCTRIGTKRTMRCSSSLLGKL